VEKEKEGEEMNKENGGIMKLGKRGFCRDKTLA